MLSSALKRAQYFLCTKTFRYCVKSSKYILINIIWGCVQASVCFKWRVVNSALQKYDTHTHIIDFHWGKRSGFLWKKLYNGTRELQTHNKVCAPDLEK